MRRPVTPPKEARFHPVRLARRFYHEVLNQYAKRLPLLRTAKLVISGSRLTTSLLPEDVRAKTITVPYSGIEHDHYLPGKTRHRTGTFKLLYVGRVIPYKGIELLLRGMAQAAKTQPVSLDVIGHADPVFQQYCQQLIADLGISDSVTFHARMPRAEILSHYQSCDAFCFPSLSETYGVALLEAMSCGCPCIVTDYSGPGEILPQDCGVKVPLTTPEESTTAFAAAILKLATDTAFHAQCGANARAHILREHHWPRILTTVRAAYAQAGF